MLNQCFIDVNNDNNTYKLPTNYAKISIDNFEKNANLKILYLYSFIAGWHITF